MCLSSGLQRRVSRGIGGSTGVCLSGRKELVVDAVKRWFSQADDTAGAILYSQVSRDANSDLLAAHGRVDGRLVIRTGEGDLDFVPTTLLFWGLTWNHLLSYVGVANAKFGEWFREMLIAIGRSDLVDE